MIPDERPYRCTTCHGGTANRAGVCVFCLDDAGIADGIAPPIHRLKKPRGRPKSAKVCLTGNGKLPTTREYLPDESEIAAAAKAIREMRE